ncbi:MAG TPA: hypothetical protein VGE21_00280 [Flavobacteriales bacterium]
MGLKVQALTSEERDALNRRLQADGGMRVAYACVPAGILILEHDATERSAAEVREVLLARVGALLPAPRIMESDIEQQDAERRCATARGQ